MAYQVVLASKARRALYQLPIGVAAAVSGFVKGPLAENPQRMGRPLLWPPWEGHFGARRGEYRVIYRIHDDWVELVNIRHRSVTRLR